MERENFYILLDLSIDPPETDPEAIESAITRKQSEWSRLRNHPIKGLQAQKFISMIPEIRRVMSDPDLREKEAAAAKDSNVKDKADKIVEIDRHIDILMGKGYISKEDIVRLAQVHEMAEKEIQNRIRIKKDERFTRIDQQLSLRMAKGYITEEEINKLAKRHNFKPEEIKSRVYNPMLKNGKTKTSSAPRQMDRSIEKSIRENLKIVDKKSLYDFLSLHESTELEVLQEAAIEKKKQLASAGKKDARVTAGNILAGHCVTIFKNEETRIAYDISLAKSKLAELDSDIDVSGFNGKIRNEYYEVLVRKAMDFGMEKHEAERYIKDYCKRKKWAIEPPKGTKRKFIMIAAGICALLAALSAAGFFYVNYRQEQAINREYAGLIARVDASDNIDEQLAALRQFIQTHQGEREYAALVDDARRRIDIRLSKREEKQYAEMSSRVDSWLQDGDFDAAKSQIAGYLETDPPAQYADKARKKKAEIDSMAEKRDFEALSRIVINADIAEKIRALTSYIDTYPDGENISRVRELLNDMSNEYYIYIENALEKAEAEKNWEKCEALALSYIELYDNSQADTLKGELDRYRQNIRREQVFQALQQKAAGFGEDYERARRVYTDYLKAYPNTPIKKQINEEVGRLNRLIRKAEAERIKNQLADMIRASGGRFVETGEEVVKDAETGLMWTLLDSAAVTDKPCMTFDDAVAYTEDLSTGGYSDWRLPTAAELLNIYKTDPAFPVIEEKWYWSADSYSGYSEEWYRIVDTITASPGGKAVESRRDSRECGVVRAVRD
ncbi:MAG: DUF1566 domain-containing protein [Thermodesulfobacteriota bacterium]